MLMFAALPFDRRSGARATGNPGAASDRVRARNDVISWLLAVAQTTARHRLVLRLHFVICSSVTGIRAVTTCCQIALRPPLLAPFRHLPGDEPRQKDDDVTEAARTREREAGLRTETQHRADHQKCTF